MKREKVSFTTENGRTEEFFVEEETRIEYDTEQELKCRE